MNAGIHLRAGDCLDVFGTAPDESFDAFVSDWPAGVAFMGRAWDKATHLATPEGLLIESVTKSQRQRDAWIKAWALRAALMRRKAKPGAYSLTWALPRTAHWTMTALEDGGWQVQDVIVHVFGQGFPKVRTALKPASEHWILARNGGGGALQIDACRVERGEALPVLERVPGESGDGLFGRNGGDHGHRTGETSTAGSWPPNFVLSHCPECEERGTRKVKGAGAFSGPARRGAGVSDARGSFKGTDKPPAFYGAEQLADDFDCVAGCDCGATVLAPTGGAAPRCACGLPMWWACPVAEMDRQSGERPSGIAVTRNGGGGKLFGGINPGAKGFDAPTPDSGYTDAGGASRFFPRFCYEAKANGGERDAGCAELFWRVNKRNPFGFDRITREEWSALGDDQRAHGNVHPTVKRIELMEWLCSLVCPPLGSLGDITLGSGGTAIAWQRVCTRAGVVPSFLGSDICPEAVEIALARLAWWSTVRLDVKPKKEAPARQDEPQRLLF